MPVCKIGSVRNMNSDTLENLVIRPLEEWYGSIVDIPCELIKPDPENLRREFDEVDLLDLGNNMKSVGQLDELTVFPVTTDASTWAGYFDLHDGERRWRAARSVGLQMLRAKLVPRPSDQELMFKRVCRVLQTRSLSPETKLAGLEKALSDLGILEKPDQWESFKDRLGGGPEWPQLIRVLRLQPKVRLMFENGLLNFTIAQAIGRVEEDIQEPLAQFAVVNKINGRFLSTQMVPYLIEHPGASPAQAFEHTRVGGWRQFTRSPYGKGASPPTQEQVERFLDACVAWERAWETVVVEGLVHAIEDKPQYVFRLKDASRRIQERAAALAQRVGGSNNQPSQTILIDPGGDDEDSKGENGPDAEANNSRMLP